jgi:hypothetical protein
VVLARPPAEGGLRVRPVCHLRQVSGRDLATASLRLARGN